MKYHINLTPEELKNLETFIKVAEDYCNNVVKNCDDCKLLSLCLSVLDPECDWMGFGDTFCSPEKLISTLEEEE